MSIACNEVPRMAPPGTPGSCVRMLPRPLLPLLPLFLQTRTPIRLRILILIQRLIQQGMPGMVVIANPGRRALIEARPARFALTFRLGQCLIR